MAPTLPLRHASQFLTLIGVAVLAAACGGDNGPGGSQPTSIAISAGNAQAVRYGTPGDHRSRPWWSPTRRARCRGSPSPSRSRPVAARSRAAPPTTNAQGIATVGSWTLGPAPGVNTLRATAGSISVNIDANAVTGPPSTISVVAGNNQTWVQGSLLPVAPSVVVTDGQFPVPGAHVVFAVASGGGSVSGAVQTTNTNGIATVGGWRMGTSTDKHRHRRRQSSSIAARHLHRHRPAAGHHRREQGGR